MKFWFDEAVARVSGLSASRVTAAHMDASFSRMKIGMAMPSSDPIEARIFPSATNKNSSLDTGSVLVAAWLMSDFGELSWCC